VAANPEPLGLIQGRSQRNTRGNISLGWGRAGQRPPTSSWWPPPWLVLSPSPLPLHQGLVDASRPLLCGATVRPFPVHFRQHTVTLDLVPDRCDRVRRSSSFTGILRGSSRAGQGVISACASMVRSNVRAHFNHLGAADTDRFGSLTFSWGVGTYPPMISPCSGASKIWWRNGEFFTSMRGQLPTAVRVWARLYGDTREARSNTARMRAQVSSPLPSEPVFPLMQKASTCQLTQGAVLPLCAEVVSQTGSAHRAGGVTVEGRVVPGHNGLVLALPSGALLLHAFLRLFNKPAREVPSQTFGDKGRR